MEALPAIPEPLLQYADEIRASVKDSISISLRTSTTLKPWESKVGGEPYLPLTEKYPCNSKGTPLMLLAQINFAEMPHISHFPKKGILEFYVDGADDNGYGMQFDDQMSQDGFRVLYFDHVCKDKTKLHKNTKAKQDREESPLRNDSDYAMEFSKEKQYITWQDHRFSKMTFSDDCSLIDDHYANIQGAGHRVGGYPHFTQTDPRGGKYSDYSVLLFQLDSEDDRDGIDIMWGDMGIGNFFIRPKDLKKRDFSKILYSWDCC